MAFNLTRMTVYALISSLEEDLRAVIKDYLIGSNSKANIPDELYKRAQYRLEKDLGFNFESTSPLDLIDYFDLGDTYQVINSNSEHIPDHISSIIKRNTKNFDKIIPIRNRVMHIRPLDVEDSPNTFLLCEKLTEYDDSVWTNISTTLALIHENPAYVLGLEIKNLEDVYENHNLPIPDFDETGLIGRNEDVKK